MTRIISMIGAFGAVFFPLPDEFAGLGLPKKDFSLRLPDISPHLLSVEEEASWSLDHLHVERDSYSHSCIPKAYALFLDPSWD